MNIGNFLQILRMHRGLYVGPLIILLIYSIQIYTLQIPKDKGFYLSWSLPTDVRYIELLHLFDVYLADAKINFPWAQMLLDHLILKLLGFETLWILVPIYKLATFGILYYGFSRIFKTDGINLFIGILLALFLCSDIQPFTDRFPRPLNTNIPFSVIFICNILMMNKATIGQYLKVLLGVSYGVLLFSNPWAAVALLAMTIYIVKSNLRLLIDFRIVLGGILSGLPQLILLFQGHAEGSYHSQYLGLKEIYNLSVFLIDYILAYSDKYLVFFTLIFLFLSAWLRCFSFIAMFFFCWVVLPLPFLVAGVSIQAYHLTIILKDLLIFMIVYLVLLSVDKQKVTFFNFEIIYHRQIITITVFAFIIVYKSFTGGNSWLTRAENSYTENVKIFAEVDKIQHNCILISNDANIQTYWASINAGRYFPKDGFFRGEPEKVVLSELKTSMDMLEHFFELDDADVQQIVLNSTHNLYAVTRATIASNLISQQNLMRGASAASSMEPWHVVMPREVLEDNANPENAPNYEYADYTLVFNKNGDIRIAGDC